MSEFHPKAERRMDSLARAILQEIEPETEVIENAILEQVTSDHQLGQILSGAHCALSVRSDRDHGDDLSMIAGSAAGELEDAARMRAHEVAASAVRQVATEAPELRRSGVDLNPAEVRNEAQELLAQIEHDPEVLLA